MEHALLSGSPWVIVGGLVLVLIMVLKRKPIDSCPINEVGGTPLTKEHHDELCAEKWKLNEEKLKHIKDATIRIEAKVDALPSKINGVTKT